MNNEEFKEQLEYKAKLNKYLDNELEKVKKVWLKNKAYQISWIRLNNITYQDSFEIRTVGENYRAKQWEKEFALSEIDSRLEAVREIWKKHYEDENFTIILTPLSSGFDFMTVNNGVESFFESKSRNYSTTSDILKDGVALEKLKVDEAIEGGYYEDFYYTSKFKDGNIWTWKPSLLNLTPTIMYFPDSTLKYNRMKEKICYLLPIWARIKELDIRCS